MTRKITVITIAIICWFTTIASAQNNKVLIIGIDGCRPDALLYANTPNIDQLWKDGAYSFRAQTDPISSSGICWTGMLTGVWHQKHNVTTNAYKNPNNKKYPHFFQRVKEHNSNYRTISVVNWAPIHKILKPGESDITITCKSDKAVTKKVSKLISEKEVDAFFVQLDDVDHAGHAHDFSINSPKYLASIETADKQVGQILKALKKRATYQQENWYIIVSPDHGGSNKGHGKNILSHTTIFYIINGKDVAKGEIQSAVNVVDIPVTAMKVLGITPKKEWNLDGQVKGLINESK
ncbi:metalloenzyme superfamily [Prolixibacteraceae bacterium JC049]|nr:metalloenzyme superfamily [Prolixibacteraceae bacterium JC049]